MAKKVTCAATYSSMEKPSRVISTTFNEFLASDEGRRRANNRQADLLIADFRRHRVTVRTHKALWDFVRRHPGYFRAMTEKTYGMGGRIRHQKRL
jgi:hypothetical protein